ncbi:ribonuclease H-like domain-containing protein [Tanacetum coccineum]
MAIGDPSSSTVLINNLDVCNPLHIQTNDNSSTTLIPFKLLGTENYKIWDITMKLALQGRNKLSFVDGLVYSRNDNSFWKELESTYDKREFHALTKLPKCVCEVKCSCDVSSELVLHQQLMKLMQFLLGMDDRYQPIRSALSTWDPLPEVKDAYTAVSEEESHRGIPVSFGVFESKLNASSFATKTFNNNKRPFNNNNSNTRGSSSNSTVNRGPNPNSNCKNYGRIGHTIDRCYVIIGFPPGFKRNANCGKQSFNANTDVKINDKQSSFSISFGFTSDQMQKLLNLINDNTSGSIHASMAGRTSFFNGASQHLTMSTIGMFNVVDITSLKITVGYPNGTLATISHVWNLKLSNNVILYDVCVVPGYCVSLLSVNKLIRDSKILGHPSDQVLSVLHNDLDISKSSFVPVCEASCAHTPQQNRIAETKHRHLLNVARSLMFQGGIPLKFWSDYVMIDIYLINRLPSSVLKVSNMIDAMNSEIEALNRMNTWTVYDLPAGKKSIGCRWIYKIKYKSTGDIDRYKSRLVAKGFSQREGLMLTMLFLYGDLYEDVYMTLPQGYENVGKGKVCKHKKSLYGLKQDPRQWNAKLTTTLAKHGFKQSKFDYSLYVKQSGESFVALLVYVDDIVIIGNNDKEIDEFKKFLSSKFLIKDLGKLKYFFGIEVLENDKGLCMTQRKYCLELLHKYGQLATNPVDIPLPENIVLSHIESIDDKYLKNFTSYQKLVGKLIYLTNTRLDFSCAITNSK